MLRGVGISPIWGMGGKGVRGDVSDKQDTLLIAAKGRPQMGGGEMRGGGLSHGNIWMGGGGNEGRGTVTW